MAACAQYARRCCWKLGALSEMTVKKGNLKSKCRFDYECVMAQGGGGVGCWGGWGWGCVLVDDGEEGGLGARVLGEVGGIWGRGEIGMEIGGLGWSFKENGGFCRGCIWSVVDIKQRYGQFYR